MSHGWIWASATLSKRSDLTKTPGSNRSYKKRHGAPPDALLIVPFYAEAPPLSATFVRDARLIDKRIIIKCTLRLEFRTLLNKTL